MDTKAASKRETGVLVKIDISFHTEESHTHFPGLPQRIKQEFESVTFALIFGMDADGAERPGGLARTVRQHQFRLGEHNVANQSVLLLHYKVKLRNEVRVVPVAMQHKVFCASGTINIPESLAGEDLNRTAFFRSFKSDFHYVVQ